MNNNPLIYIKVLLSMSLNFSIYELCAGADPAKSVTDAKTTASVGGFGGILPQKILKFRTVEMRFPAFWVNF